MKNLKKNLRSLALLAALALLTFSAVRGQQWTVYNSGNSGLHDDLVYSIAIDGNGTIWIGTFGRGLAKFDGINWMVYKTGNSGLSNDSIISIAIDGNGNKWIGTNGGGLAKFDDINWTVYNTSNSGLTGNIIQAISIDAGGNKWISAWGKGLVKFDGANWTTYNTGNSGLPDNNVMTIAIDGSGNKWIGTNYGGLAKFDGTNWTVYNTINSGLPHDYVFSIAIDGSDNKWIGTYGYGLAKFDGTNWQIYNTSNSALPFDYVHSIAIDGNGNKWIGTSGGVAKFDGINWTVYIPANSGLPHHCVTSIVIYGNGNKWIGTYGGIAKFADGGAGPLNGLCVIKGSIYNDLNGNGIQDNGELSLPWKMVKILNDSTYATSQNNGNFYLMRPAGTYQIKYVPNQYWQLTSDSVLTVVVTPTSTYIDSVNFGIKMLTSIPDVSVDFVGNIARAGFQVDYWLTYKNEGTITTSGNVTFDLDPLTGFVSSNPAPDAQNGNTITWNYSNLVSLEQRQIYLTLQMPDVSHLGEVLVFAATINPVPGDIAPVNNTDRLAQVIVASYDPNDKSVNKGVGTPGYTLFGEELSYTIRFQNTGTDTAFTVQIRDTINSNLDVATLRIVSTSHNMQTDVKDKNVVTFIFNNILLPDSNTNEPKSHGFVKFAIKPLPGLAENTVVTNDAYIYFDFNPAVPTNEVLNTFVSTIPSGVELYAANGNGMVICPNPAKEELRLKIQSPGSQAKNSKEGRYFIYSSIGQLISEGKIKSEETRINVSGLPKGLYLLRAESGKKNFAKKFIKE